MLLWKKGTLFILLAKYVCFRTILTVKASVYWHIHTHKHSTFKRSRHQGQRHIIGMCLELILLQILALDSVTGRIKRDKAFTILLLSLAEYEMTVGTRGETLVSSFHLEALVPVP